MIPNLVLASTSPRRKELLALGGQPFAIQPVDVNEDELPGEDPAAYVLRLAREKALAGAQAWTGSDAILVAADTTVVHHGRILGKPLDAADAKAVLQSLRAQEHTVLSAIAVLRTADGAMLTDLAVTQVPMRDYTDSEIDAYIATGNPLDKAGSYAIQHAGFHPVVGLTGCKANVIGLPLCHLVRTLAKWDLTFDLDLPAACQAHLDYISPVAEDILAWRQ